MHPRCAHRASVSREPDLRKSWLCRTLRRVAAALCAAAVFSSGARAADAPAASYPRRPIRLVVPYVAGGGTDFIARLLSQKLGEKFGQQVIVDNRPGGNTVIGTQAVASAEPDGHTLLVAISSFAINPFISANLPYDSFKDFAPVSELATTPFLMAVHSTVPARNLKDVLALLRAAQPGEWDFATVGSAGIGRIAGETFAIEAGAKMQHIPYKGAAQVVAALVSGEVKFTIDPPGPYIEHIRAGKVRGLAISSARRLASLPDVPTFAEQGMPQFDLQIWTGLLAPAATPKPIIDKLAAAVQEALASPEVKEKLVAMETEPIGSSPKQFAAFLKSESERFARVVKAASIKPVN
jgi:tripartite-type tricarboxylate transporter receptor subunit TctC